MSKYIDADKFLKDEIARCRCVPLVGSGDNNYRDLRGLLEETFAADVVEVVRCKDCKHYCLSDYRKSNEPKWCAMFDAGYFCPQPNDYCSYGEKE